MGAFWSVHRRDGIAFERYLAQLAPYYMNSPSLPPSSHQSVLLGLNLLNLLVAGRSADYLVAMAKLSPPLLTSPPISFVKELELCLKEGTYHRLMMAKERLPAPEYGWLVQALVETVRIGIAEGMEQAYEEISLTQAVSMLLLTCAQIPMLAEFGQKRGWHLEGERIIFPRNQKVKFLFDDQTDSKLMINRALNYAQALDQII